MSAPCPNPAGSGSARPPRRQRAFTLIELLVVIALIGVLTFVAVPAFKGFGQTNTLAAAQRQVQDDLALARQVAIKTRSPVYMVFFSPAADQTAKVAGVHNQLIALQGPGGTIGEFAANALRVMTNVIASSHSSYAFFAERNVGDQPGVARPRYLTAGGTLWKTLPDGVVFPEQMMFPYTSTASGALVFTNLQSKPVPFPLAPPFKELTTAQIDSISLYLPVLAFDAQGRCVRLDDSQVPRIPPSLTAQLRDGFVSIGLGSVFVPRDSIQTNSFDFGRAADVVETPRGNFTNTIFRVNGLTGRSKRLFWGTQP